MTAGLRYRIGAVPRVLKILYAIHGAVGLAITASGIAGMAGMVSRSGEAGFAETAFDLCGTLFGLELAWTVLLALCAGWAWTYRRAKRMPKAAKQGRKPMPRWLPAFAIIEIIIVNALAGSAIWPPVRRFGGGGHGVARERAIAGVKKIVDEFGGIDVG